MRPDPPGSRPGYLWLVNQLRGLAALLVWDHLVGQWLAQHSLVWGPDTLVDRFLLGPLNIIQHTGFLGVAYLVDRTGPGVGTAEPSLHGSQREPVADAT